MMDKQPDPTPAKFKAGAAVLSGPAGELEAMLDQAEPDTARAGVVVVCHPHPQHDGTMRNKVVTMLERALRESGLDTVRFNFRGVGASAGSYDEGRGETEDLAAVVRWVRSVRPQDSVWLAGFSFGSWIALRASVALEAAALITVAPPAGGAEFGGFEPPTCPWLLIQGEEDEVVNPEDVFAWIEGLDTPPHVVRMPETGHFFHRRLMDLRGAVKNGVRSWLPAPR